MATDVSSTVVTNNRPFANLFSRIIPGLTGLTGVN